MEPDDLGAFPPHGATGSGQPHSQHAKDTGNFWDELNYFDSFSELPAIDPSLPNPPEQDPYFGHQNAQAHPPSAARPFPAPLVAGQDDVRASYVGQGGDAGKEQKSEEVGGGSREEKVDVETDEALSLKRKKAAVAAASRATRAKKKREMDELRKRNVELLKERQEFRKIVANLQLKAQANRKAGEIDLETENKLLRAELQEHKSFIAQFKQLADGIPVSTTAKHVAMLKGAKAAVGQVLGLLNTSTVDTSWKQGFSRLHPELLIHYQRLPQGSSSTKASRINFRADAPPISASMSDLQRVQWKVWSDSDLSSRLSSHFGNVREKEIKEIDLNVDDLECEPDSQVKVYYYREKRARKAQEGVSKDSGSQEKTDNVDTIFLVTCKKDNLPYNAMPISERTPGHSIPGSGSNENPRLFPTLVMATTSTQHSKDIVAAKPGVHRIESALLEGLVIRDLGNGSVVCTVLNSYPLNPVDSYSASDFLSSTSAEGWVDDEGYMTPAAEQAGNDFMRIVAESLGPEAAKAYVMETIKAVTAAAALKRANDKL